MPTGTAVVRAIPADDGSWRIAGAPLTRSQRARSVRGDGERVVSVFETPPTARTRMVAAEPIMPPSVHVPSRAGLRAVLHQLMCPSCGEVGQMVMNGTHGTRRSVRCKATRAGGRVCGRSWAGLALAKSVDMAWKTLQEAMAAEQDECLSDDLGSDGGDPDGFVANGECGNRDVAVSFPHPVLRTVETKQIGLDSTTESLADQLSSLNKNLARTHELLAKALDIQAALQENFQKERNRADQLAESLRIAENELGKCQGPTTSSGTAVPSMNPATIVPDPPRKTFADAVRHRVPPAHPEPLPEEFMRNELRRIGAIAPIPGTPQWRSVTPLYFRNIMRCPVGQLRAIIRGAVHHDAAIAVSFIGRNVAEILCTKNRAPSLIRFLEAMSAKVMPDFKPEAESPERGSRNNTTSNRTACLLRWGKEIKTCPARAREWYTTRLAEVGSTQHNGHLEMAVPSHNVYDGETSILAESRSSAHEDVPQEHIASPTPSLELQNVDTDKEDTAPAAYDVLDNSGTAISTQTLGVPEDQPETMLPAETASEELETSDEWYLPIPSRAPALGPSEHSGQPQN
jgi:hypothetical protein